MLRRSLLLRSTTSSTTSVTTSLTAAAGVIHFKVPSASSNNNNGDNSQLQVSIGSQQQQTQQLTRLVQKQIAASSLQAVATTVSHCVHNKLLAAVAVAGAEIAKLGVPEPKSRARIEVMEEFSSIKTLLEFAEFHDEPESFERSVALSIAAGCEGRVGVCALQRQLQFKCHGDKLANHSARWYRQRADDYFEQLLSIVKQQLQQSQPCSFVFVNAPNASFADVILLSQRAVVLVQVKNFASFKVVDARLRDVWSKMGSHSSNEHRRCLDKLIKTVYDEPEKVQRHFVLAVRAGAKYAHGWPNWFLNGQAARDRHFFLMHPASKIDASAGFVVDAFQGRNPTLARFLPSYVNFRSFSLALNGATLTGFAKQLLACDINTVNSVFATLSWQLKSQLAQSLLKAGRKCAEIAGVKVASAAKSTTNIHLLEQFSSIKTLSEFSQFGDDPESFERAVALSIAAGCEGRVGVCALQRRLQFKCCASDLKYVWSRRRRQRSDDYFEQLLSTVKQQLQQSQPCNFVFVNAPNASFADVILLSQRAVVLVQVKNFASFNVVDAQLRDVWSKMGSHSSHNSRRCLDKLVQTVYDEPEKVQRHFVLAVRSGAKYAHGWPNWFQRTVNRGGNSKNRHMLLVRPSAVREFKLACKKGQTRHIFRKQPNAEEGDYTLDYFKSKN